MDDHDKLTKEMEHSFLSSEPSGNISSSLSRSIQKPLLEETLVPVLDQVTKAIHNFADKYEKLVELDNSLIEFNHSFGSFLFGMQANNETVYWKHTPTDQLLEHVLQRQAIIANPEITTLHYNKPVEASTPVTPSTGNNENTNKPKRSKSAKSNHSPTKKKKTVSKNQINHVINGLPEPYRGRTEENKNMRKVLEALITQPNGLSRKDLVKVTSLAQPKVIDCLKALTRSKDVISKKVPGEYDTFCLINV